MCRSSLINTKIRWHFAQNSQKDFSTGSQVPNTISNQTNEPEVQNTNFCKAQTMRAFGKRWECVFVHFAEKMWVPWHCSWTIKLNKMQISR